jgi:hypothetical protein
MREGGSDSAGTNQYRNVSLCQVFAQVGQRAGPKGAYEKTADGKMKKPRTGETGASWVPLGGNLLSDGGNHHN